jgi:predicted GNAT family acetyltransferase
MSARNLSKLQFNYQHMPGLNEHVVEAGEEADHGHLSWDAHTGRISQVFVPESMRRQGIATQLWNKAHEEADKRGIVPPKHSDVRTIEGDKWAQKVSPGTKPASKIVEHMEG